MIRRQRPGLPKADAAAAKAMIGAAMPIKRTGPRESTGGKAPPFFGASLSSSLDPPPAKASSLAQKRKAELDEKKKQARKQRKTEADEKKKQANKSKENARHHRLKRAVSDETEKQARKQRYSCSWAREEC